MTTDPHKSLEGRITVLERHHAVDEVHRAQVTTKLDEIEDTLKWLSRLIFGGLVLAIIGYIAQGGIAV